MTFVEDRAQRRGSGLRAVLKKSNGPYTRLFSVASDEEKSCFSAAKLASDEGIDRASKKSVRVEAK